MKIKLNITNYWYADDKHDCEGCGADLDHHGGLIYTDKVSQTRVIACVRCGRQVLLDLLTQHERSREAKINWRP